MEKQPRLRKLPPDLLAEYAYGFFGYGAWSAKIWFVGVEEAGGGTVADVNARLRAWNNRSGKELEDLPGFYEVCSLTRWHGESATLQATWKQIIRMFLLAQGNPDTDDAILDYQRRFFGKVDGPICAAELLPLPAPNTKAWHYGAWSDLPWLQTRAAYEAHILPTRLHLLRTRLHQHRPSIVVFYGAMWHRHWGQIADASWGQAIQGRLMGFERDETAFYVTRHPVRESDAYFREIGMFLRKKHGACFRPNTARTFIGTPKRKATVTSISKSLQLRGTAYHEAGHAVIGWLAGFPTHELSIIPDEESGSLGHQKHGELGEWGEVRGIQFGWRKEHGIIVQEQDGSCRLPTKSERMVCELTNEIIEAYGVGNALVPLHCAAGLAAQSIACPESVHPGGAASDYEQAIEHTPADQWPVWLARADELLRRPFIWQYVEGLAAQLLHRHRLSGEEVQSFFEATTNSTVP